MSDARTLIFCFDGTANDPADAANFTDDGSITNIMKLHAMFGGGIGARPTMGSKRQCSFYYSGVGTYGTAIRKLVNSVLGLPNMDVGRIINTALADFERTYKPNDRILIFGFSRGAAIARIFAAKLAKEREVKVAFLGVFDTVAAMGMIDLKAETRPASDVVFENGTLHRNVEHAVHLVALDERRLAFQPTLFNHDKARILEVWFPGAHSDVGGGFWHDGLSDIALQFMLRQIELRFADDPIHITQPADINYRKLNQQGDTEETRITPDDIDIQPLPHGMSHEQQRRGPLSPTLHHRLLCVHVNDKEATRLVPLLHQSTLERFGSVIDYRPLALRNRKYQIVDDDGKAVGGVRVGVAGLRAGCT